MDSLKKMFAPRSVAVIGASRREGSLGKMFMDAIVQLDYKSKIYPINPKADMINNIPCLADIHSLPETPDLAVILLSKEMVLDTVKELAKIKVRNIVVISAGFKETGKEGHQREKTLVRLIKENNMRMIGPNSMGLFNTDPELLLNATFSPTPVIPEHIGFISQSGALGVAVFELSKKMDLGFSCFVSTGNKADIGDVDCLRYLKDDNNTEAIILYQESIDDPVSFRNVCRTIVSRKPILTLKAGRTKSGLKAASSHTGALASDDIITDAFFKQSGVIRCETLNELLDTAKCIVSQPVPGGNNIAVITNAGGPGILASDALEKNGLKLASLSENSIKNLQEILPAEAGFQNPVDMIASATHETYKAVCGIIEKDKNVDIILIVIVKPPVNTTPKEIISELRPIISQSPKPFFCVLMAREDEDAGLPVFNKIGVPVFNYPEAAASAIGNLIKYKNIQNRFRDYKTENKKNIALISGKKNKQKQIPFKEICKLLDRYKLKVPDFILTSDKEKAVEFAQNRGRIVLKIANEEIIHKSDQGLVKLDLSSSTEIENAFNHIIVKAKSLLSAKSEPLILAQEMVPLGIELVLGAKRDPLFGPVIMFGIGGVFVELYRDVVFRVLPIDAFEAGEMINELKGKKIFEGFRHFPLINRDVLVRTIINFSQLLEANPEIIEMDLNPLIWPVDGIEPVVVDSRCTIGID